MPGTNLTIATINVRKITTDTKWYSLLNILDQIPSHIDIVAIQDTGIPETPAPPNRNNRNTRAYWFLHTGWIIRNNSIKIRSCKKSLVTDRMSHLHITFNGEDLSLTNIYLHANRSCRLKLLNTILDNHHNPPNPDILLGDMNLVVDPIFDRSPPASSPYTGSKEYTTWTDTLGLKDCALSYSRNDPTRLTRPNHKYNTATRLDRILVKHKLFRRLIDTHTWPIPISDHKAVITRFRPLPPPLKQHQPPQLPPSMLEDSSFLSRATPYAQAYADGTHKLHNFKNLLTQTALEVGRVRRREKTRRTRAAANELFHLAANSPTKPSPNWAKAYSLASHKLTSTIKSAQLKDLQARKLKFLNDGERLGGLLSKRIKPRAANASFSAVQLPDGTTSSNPEDIKKYVEEFYNGLMSKHDTNPEAILNLLEEYFQTYPHKILTQEESTALSKPISSEEVRTALTHYPRKKAPGPDGIPYEAYATFKDIISSRMAIDYNNILQGKNATDSNKSTLALLYKNKGSPLDLKFWRPLTLSNTDIKILSKIYADRLQPIAARIISPNQYGFIKGRSIWDNIWALKNALEFGQHGLNTGWAIFLDQEKAYDRVSWDYLSILLNTIGFPPPTLAWINALQTNCSVTVATPTEPKPIIKVHQGLRQGDPASPILFNFAFDPFLSLIEKRTKGLHISRNTLIPALAFADDAVIMASSAKDLEEVEKISATYTAASNARFNADKYEWIKIGNPSFSPPNCPPNPPSPVRHLGILMNSQGVDIENNLKRLIERTTKTANWIGHSKVSLRARAVSLNTFALSIPLYWAHVIPMTQNFLTHCDKISRTAVWGKNRPQLKLPALRIPLTSGGLSLWDPQPLYDRTLARTLLPIISHNPKTPLLPWQLGAKELLCRALKVSHEYGPGQLMGAIARNLPPSHKINGYWKQALKAIHRLKPNIPTPHIPIIDWNLYPVIPEFPLLNSSLHPLLVNFTPPTANYLRQISPPITINWKKIHSLPIAPSIISTLWRFLTGALPKSQHRKLDDPKRLCPWGCGNVGYTLHTFIQCTKLSPIWKELQNPYNRENPPPYPLPLHLNDPRLAIIIHSLWRRASPFYVPSPDSPPYISISTTQMVQETITTIKPRSTKGHPTSIFTMDI